MFPDTPTIVTIVIDCSGEAFRENANQEVARILRGLAEAYEDGSSDVNKTKLGYLFAKNNSRCGAVTHAILDR